jgi:hypothetical protein
MPASTPAVVLPAPYRESLAASLRLVRSVAGLIGERGDGLPAMPRAGGLAEVAVIRGRDAGALIGRFHGIHGALRRVVDHAAEVGVLPRVRAAGGVGLQRGPVLVEVGRDHAGAVRSAAE